MLVEYIKTVDEGTGEESAGMSWSLQWSRLHHPMQPFAAQNVELLRAEAALLQICVGSSPGLELNGINQNLLRAGSDAFASLDEPYLRLRKARWHQPVFFGERDRNAGAQDVGLGYLATADRDQRCLAADAICVSEKSLHVWSFEDMQKRFDAFLEQVSAEGCEELLRRVSLLEQRVGCPVEEPWADLSAEVAALCVAAHCSGTTASAFAQSHRMSSGALQDEVERLREELEQLRLVVDRQGEELQELRASREGSTIEVVSNGSESPEAPPASSAAPRTLTWEFRERVAREIGGFIRRSLDGVHRGPSGRHQLGDLQNRVYIVARDISGIRFNPPILVDRFFRVRSLCQRGQDWGESVFIGLPSAKASTFSGRRILHSLLRHLLRSRCRLGAFARSFVAQQLAHPTEDVTVPAELFPMGLPYPEVFKKKNRDADSAFPLKKGVTAVVMVLNYLHLGRPSDGGKIAVRRKLSKVQWEAVRRFEEFLRSWDSVSPITPEVMGRTASKVESLEEMIEELEAMARSSCSGASSYFGHRKEEDAPGRAPDHQAVVVGKVSGSGFSTFKSVEASRLNFVGRPNFDPCPYLDPVSRQIYEDPCGVRMSPSECLVKPPKLRVHCSQNEKVRLFDLLDQSGRLRVHLPHEVCPRFGSGLFAVPKDLERDRLILDSRGANLLEEPPQRWIKSLASAESICKLVLEPWEDLEMSGNDLRDFYYLFSASASRSRRNVLVGPIHPKQIANLSAVKGHHLNSEYVFGSLNTLAMGDCQAVELAQSCHLGMALQWNVASAENLLTMYKPFPRSKTVVGLVIDDFITMNLTSRTDHCKQDRVGDFNRAVVAGSMQDEVDSSVSAGPAVSEAPSLKMNFDSAVAADSFAGSSFSKEFVSAVEAGEMTKEPSAAARLADEMQDGYERVKLIPNTKKAFRDLKEASFWGVDVDGASGLLRGSLMGAIPLAAILLRVVELGFSSRGLMEIAAGSLISLFLFRRRLMALLDSTFDSYRGQDSSEVFRVGGRLKSDLLCLVALLPMAVCNLRASPPDVVAASDASGWGEAGVLCDIPRELGKELMRHVLRKSVWNRLLSPHQAWLRTHDLLPPEDELPPGEEGFDLNPLWTLLAECLRYRLLFSKKKSGNRHINVGELRAALRTEKLLGSKKRSRRILLGLDSQVALGALLKGRSSSRSLNEELVRSLPLMLGYDVYLELMYYHTSVNRADQPTRGKEIEAPVQDLPPWWNEILEGNFAGFDEWLHAHGLDDLAVSELPDLKELCGNVSPTGIVPAFLQKSGEQRAVEKEKIFKKEAHSDDKRPQTAANLQQSKMATGHAPSHDKVGHWEASGAEGGEELPGSTSTAQLGNQTAKHGRSEPPSDPRSPEARPPLLSSAAKKMLCEFAEGQVVQQAGSQWPPDRAGYLDLFSGERGVARALARKADVWSLCFDIEDGPDKDLNDPVLRGKIEKMIKAGCFIGVGGGPVCRTFSMAVRPPVRSKTEPFGRADVSDKMRAKIEEGNSMAMWCISILELSLTMKLSVWLENPGSSWLFRLPPWRSLMRRWPELQPWTVDYCRFGTAWRKRTKFYVNCGIAGAMTLCQGGHVHQLLQGRSKKHQKSWTLVAQPYPSGVCEALACSLLEKAKLLKYDQKFDPASCAKAGAGRIGEASHPGPRARRFGARSGVLEEVPLVEPKTLVLQDKVWGSFLGWLGSTLSPGAVHSAMAHPCLLVLLAKEYGNFLYSGGRSLYVFRHLLVYLQQNFVTIRPHMSACWNMVTRWEVMEPTQHRVPLPFAVFCAMISVALGWKWERFAGILAIGFLGIARPGEPLRATRSELILPRDMLEAGFNVAYLKILKPKSGLRGRGKTQHISIHDTRFVEFLDRIFGVQQPQSRLYDCSPSAFRRRWDAILAALQIPRDSGLTPGGVRGGGCVYAFQQGADISLLLWRMRIKHLQTLESYLQEVVASTVVSELPLQARRCISTAAELVFPLLGAVQLRQP
eukprot:Skav233118  [mRNA]  locus=scaffold1342:395006:405928:- [translate_table: standard]